MYNLLELLDNECLSILNPYYHGDWERLTEIDLKMICNFELEFVDYKLFFPWTVDPLTIVHNHFLRLHSSQTDELTYLRQF